MSISSFDSSYQPHGTRAPELISRIDDSIVDKCEHDMRHIGVNCLAVNRFIIPFLEIRKVRYKASCSIMNIMSRRVKEVEHRYSMLSNKPSEVIGSSLICLGSCGLDT
jgi:hypothetical protein